MEKEWIVFIGTISGVVIGWALSLWKDGLQHSRLVRTNERQLHLAKIDEIHLLVIRFCSISSEYGMDVLKLMASRLDHNEYVAELARLSRQPKSECSR